MAPNQPKTPVSSYRFTAEDKARLQRVTEAMQRSATEALRLATRAAESWARFAVYSSVREPNACRLGDGHTPHIWELSQKEGEPMLYFCAGQPFSNGYDPIDDEDSRAMLKALGFLKQGLQPCCGASNQVCGDRHPIMLSTGCQRCGHPEECHVRDR